MNETILIEFPGVTFNKAIRTIYFLLVQTEDAFITFQFIHLSKILKGLLKSYQGVYQNLKAEKGVMSHNRNS